MTTTGLEVRPMFHWMPHRITALLELCALALMIERAAETGTAMTRRQLHDLLTPSRQSAERPRGGPSFRPARSGPKPPTS